MQEKTNSTLKEIISRDAKYKVVIVQRNTDLYEIATFRWTIEFDDTQFELGAFWEPISRPSLTDTFTNAE